MAAKENGKRSAIARTGVEILAKSPEATTRPNSNNWFVCFAHATSRLAGRPATFLVAVLMVVVWAATGPLFNYSDTWQLVINTSTTIITFLMVFLIQNTQNRDTLALQVKLAELIIVMKGASNKLATAEDLSEEDLEELHAQYARAADDTLASLRARRAAEQHAEP